MQLVQIKPGRPIGSKSALKAHPNKVGRTVYGFAGGQAGANAAFAALRGPIGLEYGSRNIIRSAGAFDMAAGLGKEFPIVDEVHLQFRADFFNVFNHANFAQLQVNIVTNQAPFGQITNTINTAAGNPRVGQFSLRLEF